METDCDTLLFIAKAKIVFWDFDGVIKDSVNVKTAAFEKLFVPYGYEISKKVVCHHEANGGVSRFDKIPLYLSWAGEEVTDELVEIFCNRFSRLVIRSVIESPWVPGVFEYLEDNFHKQYFVLLTATPQKEIEEILISLEIGHFFREVFGAPFKKVDKIKKVLRMQKITTDQVLMIGDSETDFLAAESNGVPFLLRRTSLNGSLQDRHIGISVRDFTIK